MTIIPLGLNMVGVTDDEEERGMEALVKQEINLYRLAEGFFKAKPTLANGFVLIVRSLFCTSNKQSGQ